MSDDIDWRKRALEAEEKVAGLAALVNVSPDDVRAVTDENIRVEAENERLRKAFDDVIKSLESGGPVRVAFCSWCNQRWPQLDGETYETTRKYANEHAQACPAHPLRIERDELKKIADAFGLWLGEGGSLGAVTDAYRQYVERKP